VNYLDHGVDTILGYDINNCIYYVDPSSYLFYEGCAFFNEESINAYDANPLTDITGYPPEWFNVVDIRFKDTNYYIEANRAQVLNGFSYPSKVVFGNINQINSCIDANCGDIKNT
jgi:hypothetical protein